MNSLEEESRCSNEGESSTLSASHSQDTNETHLLLSLPTELMLKIILLVSNTPNDPLIGLNNLCSLSCVCKSLFGICNDSSIWMNLLECRWPGSLAWYEANRSPSSPANSLWSSRRSMSDRSRRIATRLIPLPQRLQGLNRRLQIRTGVGMEGDIEPSLAIQFAANNISPDSDSIDQYEEQESFVRPSRVPPLPFLATHPNGGSAASLEEGSIQDCENSFRNEMDRENRDEIDNSSVNPAVNNHTVMTEGNTSEDMGSEFTPRSAKLLRVGEYDDPLKGQRRRVHSNRSNRSRRGGGSWKRRYVRRHREESKRSKAETLRFKQLEAEILYHDRWFRRLGRKMRDEACCEQPFSNSVAVLTNLATFAPLLYLLLIVLKLDGVIVNMNWIETNIPLWCGALFWMLFLMVYRHNRYWTRACCGTACLRHFLGFYVQSLALLLPFFVSLKVDEVIDWPWIVVFIPAFVIMGFILLICCLVLLDFVADLELSNAPTDTVSRNRRTLIIFLSVLVVLISAGSSLVLVSLYLDLLLSGPSSLFHVLTPLWIGGLLLSVMITMWCSLVVFGVWIILVVLPVFVFPILLCLRVESIIIFPFGVAFIPLFASLFVVFCVLCTAEWAVAFNIDIFETEP